MKKVIILTAIIAIAVGIGVFGYPKLTAKKLVNPDNPVAIGASKTAVLVWIAQKQELFKKHGVNVIVKEASSGVGAAKSLLNKEVDLATSSEFVLVNNSLKNNKIQIISTISSSNDCSLIARKDKNINSLAELEGKTIGVHKGGIAEFFLGRLLKKNNIANANIQNIKTPDLVDNFVAGNIDAFLSWEPHVYRAQQQLNKNSVNLTAPNNESYYFLLTTLKDFSNDNPVVIQKILQALTEASSLVTNNPELSKRILKEKFNFTPEFIDYFWNLHQYVVALPQSLLLLMENEAKWLSENQNKSSVNIPNYLEYIDKSHLEKLRAESVTIF